MAEDRDITGKWVRIGQMGPMALDFKTDGMVEGDLGNDQTIDIVSRYSIREGEISFKDQKGVACPEPGRYQLYTSEYYISFDLIEDNCAGRLRSTMGFWVRPDFKDRLEGLSEKIASDADPEDYLNRGRMYLATGKPDLAGKDFDEYISHNPSDARVFVNRAATRMNKDPEGVISDCTRALDLEPDNKNAYFLRGLARYGRGNKEGACEDFYRAIELGFNILKEAEYEKCAEFWKSIQ